MGIRVDLEKCTGCGACISVCPFGLTDVVNDKLQIKEGCNLCGACQQACAYDAIIIEMGEKSEKAADDFRGVMVFAEQRHGRMKGVAYELASEGRKLADALDTELSAVCLGHQFNGVEQLFTCGVDRVYAVDSPLLAKDEEDYYVQALVELIRDRKPEVFLAGATSLGRSFIPRVAAILQTGLTADCTGLDIDPQTKLLKQTRPTFGGNIMATIICESRRPQMCTVRPRVFKKAFRQNDGNGEIIKVDFGKAATTSRTKLLSFVEELSGKVKLEDADVIVSGGRGLGKPENFHLIRELAAVLGAAVGSSRPPVDEGWIPYPHQVGQTGKTVSPKLYIACGISGSVQHLAGMQTSDIIVAINEDPNAPIFEVATYGIVGDLFKVVPLLTTKFKELRG